jgi:hypothetical protein
MEYFFSQHALEQMHFRGISKTLVEEILREPEQRIEEEHLTVFQSIRTDENKETFLIRVFVNEKKTPNVVITVYKTSKIQKYYESKI